MCSMRNQNRQLNMLWIARKRIGLGQKSVALRLGHKTASTISEYETGRLTPNLRTALKLAAIYHTPVEKLYATLNAEVGAELATAEQKYGPVSRPDRFNPFTAPL